MSKYQTYSKKRFELELYYACKNQNLGFFQMENDYDEIMEYMYTISTKNRAVDILIFSSVDKRTGNTREKGVDCVRLVLRWKTKYGYLYKRIGKHYRVENLFKNMVGTIKKARENVFDLIGNDFNRELKKEIA